jgi:RecA-family ATPase
MSGGVDAGAEAGDTDPRGRRVAVVADSLLEQLLPELQQEGYGIIQLPPTGLPGEVASEWLEQVAEHVQEFLRTGYEVVLADDGSQGAALAELALPQYAIQPPSTSRFVPET